ncbi:UDP-N-acetylglucosamine--undecaprenyl-phosphate N-acetylglucosaminephosphotransferase [Shewanella sp.]|uniref:UDP-N-acetylglucosamine--undecaprenyl-phosphate N-acetylglucosaminephosphotransferase n=1 Tax=Shewanella sp. TaxID=50422 RepID=UPI001ED6A05B|nr:UDP-N-acetylglucosamine--undecaprenyl-phosphate N-acetylglucosaminephosphotransferase [Shewanella sp.]NRB25024.1 UDP-N-acetylglucosamine--undecaprenyl-phosphate N-acetylglucosaminephosphotransferase [Shewanella sp.]
MSSIYPVIITFIMTCLAINLLKPLATQYGLVDSPNERKHHTGEIPLIGGLAIYLSILLATMIFVPQSQELNLYLISSALILFLGVLDDKYDLSVKLRIVAQVIIASMMIFGAGLYLTSLGEIFYFFDLQLGLVGVFVTVIAVIGSINAFNMVDGIDGLAGTLSVVTFSSLGYLLYQADSEWYMLSVLYVSALLAYLMFNLRWPSSKLQKIFMGDAGSMLIGLTVVWLLVVGTNVDTQAFSPVIALYLIAIPLMDMAAIMYRRVKKGTSPFKPDRDHLHHIFERAGYTRKQTLVRISILATLIALLGLMGENYNVPEWIMFAGFLMLFSAYNWALSNVWKILTWIRQES